MNPAKGIPNFAQATTRSLLDLGALEKPKVLKPDQKLGLPNGAGCAGPAVRLIHRTLFAYPPIGGRLPKKPDFGPFILGIANFFQE